MDLSTHLRPSRLCTLKHCRWDSGLSPTIGYSSRRGRFAAFKVVVGICHFFSVFWIYTNNRRLRTYTPWTQGCFTFQRILMSFLFLLLFVCTGLWRVLERFVASLDTSADVGTSYFSPNLGAGSPVLFLISRLSFFFNFLTLLFYRSFPLYIINSIVHKNNEAGQGRVCNVPYSKTKEVPLAIPVSRTTEACQQLSIKDEVFLPNQQASSTPPVNVETVADSFHFLYSKLARLLERFTRRSCNKLAFTT